MKRVVVTGLGIISCIGNTKNEVTNNLRNLNYLHLGGNRIKSEEAKSALKNSSKLTKLEKLKIF